MDSKVGSHHDIFSCLVAACLLCGEEQEDVSAAVCLHNLGRIRLFFLWKSKSDFFRGLKLSVAVKISQDCFCHNCIQITMT